MYKRRTKFKTSKQPVISKELTDVNLSTTFLNVSNIKTNSPATDRKNYWSKDNHLQCCSTPAIIPCSLSKPQQAVYHKVICFLFLKKEVQRPKLSHMHLDVHRKVVTAEGHSRQELQAQKCFSFKSRHTQEHVKNVNNFNTTILF